MTERFQYDLVVETMDQVNDCAAVRRGIKAVLQATLQDKLANLRIARITVRTAKKLGAVANV